MLGVHVLYEISDRWLRDRIPMRLHLDDIRFVASRYLVKPTWWRIKIHIGQVFKFNDNDQSNEMARGSVCVKIHMGILSIENRLEENFLVTFLPLLNFLWPTNRIFYSLGYISIRNSYKHLIGQKLKKGCQFIEVSFWYAKILKNI